MDIEQAEFKQFSWTLIFFVFVSFFMEGGGGGGGGGEVGEEDGGVTLSHHSTPTPVGFPLIAQKL